MPPNLSKKCSFCGKSGHNLRGCSLPGAAKLRALLTLESSSKSKSSRGASRVLRGTGVAAQRKKDALKRPASQQKALREESSETIQRRCSESQGKDRSWTGPSLPRLGSEEAIQQLQDHGALVLPHRCGKCNTGTLHGPFPEHRSDSDDVQAFYCDSCRQPTNVLHLCPVVMACFERARGITASKLWSLLLCFFAPEAPSVARCARASGIMTKACIKLMRILRQAEARLARRQLQTLRLSGRLEVDASLVRKAYISKDNAVWSDSVEEWKRLHPGSSVPKYFICDLFAMENDFFLFSTQNSLDRPTVIHDIMSMSIMYKEFPPFVMLDAQVMSEPRPCSSGVKTARY